MLAGVSGARWVSNLQNYLRRIFAYTLICRWPYQIAYCAHIEEADDLLFPGAGIADEVFFVGPFMPPVPGLVETSEFSNPKVPYVQQMRAMLRV